MITRRASLMIVLVAALLAAMSLLAVRRLHVDTSLASLFDETDAAGRALVRVLDHFSAAEELLILAQSPADQPPRPDKLIAFARRLEDAIGGDHVASNLSGGVNYRADEQMRRFIEQVLVPNAIFYLDDAAFDAARVRLTRQQMVEQIRRNETLIATPGPAADALAKVILKDPLRLHEFLLERIAGQLPMKTYQGTDAFIASDGRALLIRIRGRRPVSDLEFAKQFTAAIAALADGANTDHLRIDYAGAYAIAARSAQAIRRDMIGSVVSSVICLQLLFILAFRRPIRSFLLAFLPVALGVLYGFGVYALLARTLTPMTAVIGGVLAGMAIDYAIAFLCYYQTSRSHGRTPSDAATDTWRRVGAAIMAAWATSIVGFVVLGFSHVKALRDFALMGGLGLTGAFICAMIVLPAILLLTDRAGAIDKPQQRIPIQGILARLLGRPAPVLIATAAIFIAAVVILMLPGPILPLESDLSVMHPRPNPPLDAQELIARRMGISPGALIVHLQAADEASLLHLAHQVDARIRQRNVKDAGVVATVGLASVLPDPAVAPARISATGQALADRVIADFRAAIADSIFDPVAFQPYEEFLRGMLTATQPPGMADLLRYPRLAETMLPSSATRSPGSPVTESITLLFTRDAGESREQRDQTVAAVRESLHDLPGVALTGLSVLNHDTELLVRRDLPRLVTIAVIIVTVYLALHFRNLADCIMAMLPTVFGLVCLLAFMRLTGQKLNMINLVAFPLLIGIDVDYGIFVVSAVRRRDVVGLSKQALIDRLAPAAAAVMLCAATTFVGFISLAFTSVPAVRSLGIAVAVGVFSCAAATFLLVMPLCFVLSRRGSPR